MRRIVFLDIDGVLNSVAYDRARRPGEGNIDESRLPLLRELVDRTGAEIVLSSSWRKHWAPAPALCDEIGRELSALFARYGLAIADRTPQLDAADRPREVRAWLEAHAGEIESYVIFDDDLFGWGDLDARFVKTNCRIGRGLETYHIEKALELLGTSVE